MELSLLLSFFTEDLLLYSGCPEVAGRVMESFQIWKADSPATWTTCKHDIMDGLRLNVSFGFVKPISFIDASGEIKGVEVDLVRIMSSCLGFIPNFIVEDGWFIYDSKTDEWTGVVGKVRD